MPPEQQAQPDQTGAPAVAGPPEVPADSGAPPEAPPNTPSKVSSKWTNLMGVFRSRLARQLAIASAIAGAVVAIGHVVGGLIGWWHLYELAFLRGDDAKQASAPAAVTKKPRLSLVVLPLAGEGDAQDAGWFTDVLSSDLTIELGRLSGAFVISRESAWTYKGKQADPREVSRDLNVRYVVRGTVRRTGNDVRLHLALIDGETGAQRWAEQSKLDRSNLERSLEQVAARMSRTLGVELYRAEGQRAAAMKPEQVEADDLAMQGWSVWYRGISRENSLEAARLFEAAVAQDRDSIRGWAGVGLVWGNAVTMGYAPDPKAALARRQEAVKQLERLDPNDAMTLMARTGGFWFAGDFKGLLRLTQTIVERVPNNPFGFHYLALAHLNLGRFEECVAPARQAILLGPRDSQIAAYRTTLALCHFMAEAYASAAEEAQLAVQSNTALAGPALVLAASLARDGKAEEARRIVETRRGKDPRFQSAAIERVLAGAEPRLSSGKERLVSTLKSLGVP
jgi:TolB-like protein